MLAKSDLELGKTDMVTKKTDTGDHLPIKQKPYKISFPQMSKIIMICKTHIIHIIGIICPYISCRASPIGVVNKKDGSKRPCVYCRRLNQTASTKNAYPLPGINDKLASLMDAKVFTSLDCRSGCHQVMVN